ncbi:MAG: efflux RND transporter periplasmic adaptor subunit, partial [Ruminococcus sp.]|nr:efflux RND transporter periplasmic adaptor subunit [Ruminococcus sp.]
MSDSKSEMENRDPAKKRSIIRGIVIVFLVILLVLTFFSNTIMNKSLAQVTTAAVTSGKLTERIRGNGTVEPQQSYEVTVDDNVTIDTIMVKKGQEVKQGDILFTVAGSTGDELTQAQDAVRDAELNYQQELLTQKDSSDQQSDEINKARKELNDAIEKRDEAASNESYNNELKNAKANSESALSYQKNIQQNLSNTIAAIDMDDYSMAAPEYTGDINLLKSRAEDAERVYEMALNANSEDVAEKETAMNEA